MLASSKGLRRWTWSCGVDQCGPESFRLHSPTAARSPHGGSVLFRSIGMFDGRVAHLLIRRIGLTGRLVLFLLGVPFAEIVICLASKVDARLVVGTPGLCPQPKLALKLGLLLANLRRYFAEFLQHRSLKRLGILYQSTCVGLGYGLYGGAISWNTFAAPPIQ